MNNKISHRNNYSVRLVLIIVILYCIVIFFQVAKGDFLHVPGTNTVNFLYGKTIISSFSMHFATIILIFAGVFKYHSFSKVNIYSLFSFWILGLYMLVYFVSDILEYGFLDIIHQTAGPMVYFVFFGMFITFNENNWEILVKVCRIIAPVLLITSFFVTLSFLKNYGGYIGNSPQILLLGNGFWAMAIATIGTAKKDKLVTQLFFIICIGFGLATSILYATRSWTVQCSLLLLLYYFKQTSIKRINIFYVFISVVLLYLGFTFLDKNFSDNLEYLSDRLYNNTRSFQYDEIFSQFSLGDLFFGRGTFGTYYSSLYGNYAYIDNTLIYILFHWGLIPMLCVFLLYFVPVLDIFIHRRSKECTFRAIIIILWLLSINGLSVYNTIIFDLRNALIVFTLGKCYGEMLNIKSHNLWTTGRN